MFISLRKPEPPPPSISPIKALWIKVGVPILVAIFLSLLGVVYNGLAEEVNKKVDRETLQQMIVNQKQLIENNQKNLETQQRNIEKQQETLSKTIEMMIQIQTQQNMKSKVEKPKETIILTPEALREYLKSTK